MDYIIVGAGIAGLHAALRISTKYPSASILIIEANKSAGGRVDTSDKYHWEKGAGRIHSSHKLVLKYIKNYKLTLIPISNPGEWREAKAEAVASAQEDIWPSIVKILHASLSTLKPSILATHTVKEILTKMSVLGQDLLDRFPYRSEISTMRADLALASLNSEMSSSEFFVVKEGLGTLIAKMCETLRSRGVEFLFSHRLVSVTKDNITVKEGEHLRKKSFTAKRTILAIPSEALKGVSPFQNLPVLKRISMEPLLRTYAVFPTPAWFEFIPKTVTNSPLRHIIPINSDKGTIMTSYTDSEDTKHWVDIYNSNGSEAVCREIMKELRKLFKDIPDPLVFKYYYWKHGCSYWLPGLYDPYELSRRVQQPIPLTLPNIFVCGESFSMKQAWIEGALEHTEDMLQNYIIRN